MRNSFTVPCIIKWIGSYKDSIRSFMFHYVQVYDVWNYDITAWQHPQGKKSGKVPHPEGMIDNVQ